MELDASTIWVLIPVSAIVLGIGSGIIAICSRTLQAYLQHRERMASLGHPSGSTQNSESSSEIQQLKEEIARLRDTTTQYDMSIQHTLEDVQMRLSSIENNTYQLRPVTVQTPTQSPTESPVRIG